jgi:GAF domain-containing protein
MPSVWVKNGPLKGKTFELRDAVITVGRDPTETIQVLDQGISRQHARIFRSGEMCFIRDLGSTNGTFVNDRRAQEELLRSGDVIRIGSTLLGFEDRPGAAGPPPDEIEYAGPEIEGAGSTTVELRLNRAAPATGPTLGREVAARHIEVLYEIARIAAAEQDALSFYGLALEPLAQAVQADRAYVFLVDPCSGKLVPRCVHHEGPPGERKVSRAIVKEVMQSGRSVLTSDAGTDERFAPSESVVLRRIRSVIAAPILVDGKPAGLVYLHRERPDGALGQAELELATAAAIQLGMAAAAYRSAERARQATHGLVRALVAAAELKTPQRQGHAARVAQYASAIAAQLGMRRTDLQRLQLASLLHDVGQLAVPAEPPPGADRDAWAGEHVRAGEKIVGAIPGLEDLVPLIRFHHERADGTGFPYGRRNDETPEAARILIVANLFDLMCSYGGPAGNGLPINQVLVDLGRTGAGRYDARVIEALLVAHRNGSLYQAVDPFN